MYQNQDSTTANVAQFSDLYTVLGVLGEGSFGQVTHCINNKKEDECAVKIFKKSKINRESLFQESKILAGLKHRNIVRFRKARENSKHVFIEMEVCKGGTLRSRLEKKQRFTDAEAALVMRNIFEAVKYLHDKDIIHRDLKPDNILFKDEGLDSVKIIDFGLSYKNKEEDEFTTGT